MDLSADLELRLRELVKVFLLENAKVNLSAFRTEEACWTGNVLDSLAAADLPQFKRLTQGKILDIGTGGGFPLLPLALALPNLKFTGLDATQKKIDAVQHVAEAMRLQNVELISMRAEALGHENRYREKFDIVTARAVADINVLLEYASPFVKPAGRIILWKSMNIEEELEQSTAAQKEFQCGFHSAVTYDLPGDFGQRQLLVFEKKGKLSDKYPRAIGVAKKKPM